LVVVIVRVFFHLRCFIQR